MSDSSQYNIIITIVGIVSAFLGAIIGGYLSYHGSIEVYKNQLKNEQKNIARAIDIDLKAILEYPTFRLYYMLHNYNKYDDRDESLPKDMTLTNKFYDDKTILYFVFDHDIAKLDHDLSSKIYEFYSDLFKASNCKEFIALNRLSKDAVIQKILKDKDEVMKSLIFKCGDNVSELREKLREVYES